jgi:micrococcal nuclease
MRYVGFILITLFSFRVLGGPCVHTGQEFNCVRFVKNYDADTITVDIPGLHPLIGKSMNIRVKGVDTPEIRTKNKCEKEKGRHAKKLVTNLLKKAKRIDLKNIERGKYFRKDLTHYLVKNGLGYPYDGGTKQKVDWCRSLKSLAREFQALQDSKGRKTAAENP